jgi:nucleotide-binding universal stress UspA family protein
MTDIQLLIATNGFSGTWPSIEYGAWLAREIEAEVCLLGITEHPRAAPIDDRHPLDEIFGRAVKLFEEKGVQYALEVENGDAEKLIPRKANAGEFLTLLGPLGRPTLRRWLVGRSIRHLMEEIRGPILYVPKSRLPLRKLLICVGGLGYEVAAENLAIRVAARSRASLTLLHVIPPMELDYEVTRDMRKHRGDLAETDTLPGRALRQGLDRAREASLEARMKVREGNVIEEIVAEYKDGDYDLICMGSAYSSHALRHLYTANISAEVADAVDCPLLVARFTREETQSSDPE